MVARGGGDTGHLGSVELYNPGSGTWSATDSLDTARNSHTVTLLPNGNVLLAAGTNEHLVYVHTAELYDPETAT